MATEQYIVEESSVDEEIDQIANEIAQELEDELEEGMQDKLTQKPGGGGTGDAPQQTQVSKTKELKGNKLSKKKHWKCNVAVITCTLPSFDPSTL